MAYYNLFDSHAHYDAEQFAEDRDALLQSLPGQGVRAVISVADTIDSAKRAIALAERYEYIYASAGIHPHEAQHAPEDLEQQLTALVRSNDKVRAIGEIGLDYHYDFSPRDRQQEVFRRQLALAKELDFPVIVHDREAHEDTYRLLREFEPRGVVHCYSGSAESARELIKQGLYIGFTGVVTFPNAKKVVQAAAAVPLERLLIETDCPYMAPVPLRGRRCDSSMLVHTARTLAGIKGVPVQELIDRTMQNACDLYGISL